MNAELLKGGFSDAPVEAAHAFRAAMNVMARPGTVETLAGAKPPSPLSVAAGGLLLTLCDPETPVFLAGAYACDVVRDWITFHVGAPLVGPERAVFAIGSWDDLTPLGRFAVGTPEYPDRSATMIVEEGETPLVNAILRGPGIRSTAAARLPELDAFQRNAALFPLGLDFFFTQGGRVRAVPRTTKVEAA